MAIEKIKILGAVLELPAKHETAKPPGPPGVCREAKSSTEFEFGGLVR